MIVSESLSRDFLRLIIWYPFRWCVQILPIRSALFILALTGKMHGFLNKRKKQKIERNLKRAFPNSKPNDIKTAIKTYFENHYIDRLHIFLYPKLKKAKNRKKIFTLKGVSNLESIMDKKQGAILMLGHYGPIQLPLYALGKKGFSIIQIGLPTDEGLSWIGRKIAFRLRLKYESMIPAKIYPANKFLRPVYMHLKKHGIVMMNIDPAGGGRWIGDMKFRKMFGHFIPFPIGAYALAEKTNSAILPLRIKKKSVSHFEFYIDPPIYGRNISANKNEALERMVEIYSKEIHINPGLWHFWDEYEPGKLIRSESNSSTM